MKAATVIPHSLLDVAHDRRVETIHVAFQGELGAYGDQAILQHWKGAAIPIPSASFEHVVADVAWGLADYGVLPVWNTVVGDIAAGCAAVETGMRAPYHLAVRGATQVAVRHQLLGLDGTRVEEIQHVMSHPVALAQCGRFLAEHPHIASNPVYDTAGAARDLAMSRTRSTAAIASRIAAGRYGLSILQEDIQDVPDNVTRFLILARTTLQGNGKTTPPASEAARW